ncbi:MAG TPA: hypothetical protein VHA37_09300 [Candidatus Saccharimonadales bacterium]|nr:hypothetical protein [Candidatus Saccharimonadales bacterium]
MLRRPFRAVLAVFACAVILMFASPGNAWAQRSAVFYPPSYGPTYGYYAAPSPVYVQPGWGYATFGPRIAPNYSVPVDVLPTRHYYRETWNNSPYYGGTTVYYYH